MLQSANLNGPPVVDQSKSSTFFVRLLRAFSECSLQLSQLLIFYIIARSLSPDEVGSYSSISALIQATLTIATLGIGPAIVTRGAQGFSPSWYSLGLLLVVISGSLLAGLIGVLAPLYDRFFLGSSGSVRAIELGAVVALVSAVRITIQEIFRSLLRLTAWSVYQIFESVLYVILVVVLISDGGTLSDVFLAASLGTGLTVILMLGDLLRSGQLTLERSAFERHIFARLLRSGRPALILSLSNWLLSLGDRWIIAYFVGVAGLGVYATNSLLTSMLASLAIPFWFTLFPSLAKFDDSVSKREEAAESALWGYLSLALPAYGGFLLVYPERLTLLDLKEFLVDRSIVAVIGAGVIAGQLTAVPYYSLYTQKRMADIEMIIVPAALGHFILSSILTALFELTGATMAFFFAQLVLLACLLWRDRLFSGRVFRTSLFLFPASASASMCLGLYFLFPRGVSTFAQLITLTISGLVLYAAILWLLWISRKRYLTCRLKGLN